MSLLNKVPRVPKCLKCASAPVPFKFPSAFQVPECHKCPSAQVPECTSVFPVPSECTLSV